MCTVELAMRNVPHTPPGNATPKVRCTHPHDQKYDMCFRCRVRSDPQFKANFEAKKERLILMSFKPERSRDAIPVLEAKPLPETEPTHDPILLSKSRSLPHPVRVDRFGNVILDGESLSP